MEPINVYFAEFDARRLSFVSWAYEHLVSSVVLAANGYYYLGYGAAIRCYFCGVLLNDAYCAVDAFRYHTNQCVFSDTELRRSGSANGSSSGSGPILESTGEQTFASGATWRDLFTQSSSAAAAAASSSSSPHRAQSDATSLHSHRYEHDHGHLDHHHPHDHHTRPQQQLSPNGEREAPTTTVHVARIYIGPSGDVAMVSPNNDQRDDPDTTAAAAAASMAEVADGYRARGPWYWMYAKYDQRLKTFKTWPPAMPINKQQMADAGFFYTDHSDAVTCYYCACQLRAWEPNDDPWLEHAKVRLRPGDSCYVVDRHADPATVPDYCHYVNMNKGLEFIRRARAATTDRNASEAEQTADSAEGATPIKASGSRADVDDAADDDDEDEDQEKASSPHTVLQNCLICCTESPNVLFYPCGHLVSCYRCAAGHTRCFICREKIIEVIKVFLP